MADRDGPLTSWDALIGKRRKAYENEMYPDGGGAPAPIPLNWGTAGEPVWNKVGTGHGRDSTVTSEWDPTSPPPQVDLGGINWTRGYNAPILSGGGGGNAWMSQYLREDPTYGTLLPTSLVKQMLPGGSKPDFFDKGGGVKLAMMALGLPMAAASAASGAPSFLSSLGQSVGIDPGSVLNSLKGLVPDAAPSVGQNAAVQSALDGSPWDLNVDQFTQNALNQPIVPEQGTNLMNTLGSEANNPWLNQYIDPANDTLRGDYVPEYTGSGTETYPYGAEAGQNLQDYTPGTENNLTDPYSAKEIPEVYQGGGVDPEWTKLLQAAGIAAPLVNSGKWWEDAPPGDPGPDYGGDEMKTSANGEYPPAETVKGQGAGVGGITGMIDSIAKALGLTSSQLGRLLGAVGGGIAGNIQGNKTGDVAAEQKALQTPYQQRLEQFSQNPAKWAPLDVNAMVDQAAERMGRKWSVTEGNPAESPKARISTERDIADLIYRAQLTDQEKQVELDQRERDRQLSASGLGSVNPTAAFGTQLAGQTQAQNATTGAIGSVIDTLFNGDRNEASNKQIADLVTLYASLMKKG